jgi:hypothetical protein
LDVTVINANQAVVIEHRSSYGQTACRGDGENSSCRSKFDKSQKGNSDGIMVTWSISSETFGKIGYEFFFATKEELYYMIAGYINTLQALWITK